MISEISACDRRTQAFGYVICKTSHTCSRTPLRLELDDRADSSRASKWVLSKYSFYSNFTGNKRRWKSICLYQQDPFYTEPSNPLAAAGWKRPMSGDISASSSGSSSIQYTEALEKYICEKLSSDISRLSQSEP